MKTESTTIWLRSPVFLVAVMFSLALCWINNAVLAEDVSEVFEEQEIDFAVEKSSEPILNMAQRFYAGIGFFYGFPSDLDDVTVIAYDVPMVSWHYSCPTPLETKNGFGLNLKGGYFISEHFAIEALFRYHFKYKIEGEYRRTQLFNDAISYISADADGSMEGWDFTINPKYFPFGNGIMKGRLRPYVVGGFGYMHGKTKGDIIAEVRTLYLGTTWFSQVTNYSASDSESDICGRIGTGCDWFLTDQFGVELEFDYTMGFGDVDEIKIFIISLNGLVAF